jgi:hypothetical protein
MPSGLSGSCKGAVSCGGNNCTTQCTGSLQLRRDGLQQRRRQPHLVRRRQSLRPVRPLQRQQLRHQLLGHPELRRRLLLLRRQLPDDPEERKNLQQLGHTSSMAARTRLASSSGT